MTPLNAKIYVIATVISPVNITHEQNSFKQPTWKLKIQKKSY